jgi:hypothetical protein
LARRRILPFYGIGIYTPNLTLKNKAILYREVVISAMASCPPIAVSIADTPAIIAFVFQSDIDL